jgi:hypothetical protein
MRIAIAAAMVALLAGGGPAHAILPLRVTVKGPPPVKIDWSGKPRVYHVGELSVSLAATRNKGGLAPRITVSSPRQGTVSLVGEAAGEQAPSATVYVMPLDPKADGPAVIFTSFSWGAHCCTRIDVLDPVGGRWVVVKTGSWDGDGLTEAPKDVDYDGTPDLVMRDNRFLYAFDSYAFSWAPPQILNVVGGKLSDVSASYRFSSVFFDDMAVATAECLKHSNGACAGYVADAARLGQVDTAWRVMLRVYDRTSKTFPKDLAKFLADNGYISKAKAAALGYGPRRNRATKKPSKPPSR